MDKLHDHCAGVCVLWLNAPCVIMQGQHCNYNTAASGGCGLLLAGAPFLPHTARLQGSGAG